jgi:chromosome partitioning protein
MEGDRKEMRQIISIANMKGGVGKTTTAVNLAACLSKLDKKVLLVDFDPQGNATASFGIDPDECKRTVYSLIKKECDFLKAVCNTKWGIDILPANDDLSELDILLLTNREVFSNPVSVLKEILSNLIGYGYIIIDCPPSKGLHAINAFVASTHVIVPMQCEYFAARSVSKILDTVNSTRNAYNPELQVMGILATMYNVRTNLSSIVLQDARKHFASTGLYFFDTVVSRSVKFAESPMSGMPAVMYAPENETIQSYMNLAMEVIAHG